MYVKWTPRLRKYIIDQWKLGITPITDIAKYRRVPRRTVYYLIEKYKNGGYGAIQPKPKGRKKMKLTQVKYLPNELVSPNWIDIFPEAILFVMVLSNPIAFVVRDKELASSFILF